MVFISFFFVYWYGDHRDLHSFPTRRSSDLDVRDVLAAGVAVGLGQLVRLGPVDPALVREEQQPVVGVGHEEALEDRKSTRLNSSHPSISYAVFCLKKKKKISAHRPSHKS